MYKYNNNYKLKLNEMEIYLLSLLDKLEMAFGIIAILGIISYVSLFILGSKISSVDAETNHAKNLKNMIIITIVATVLYLVIPNTKTIYKIYGDDIYTEYYDTVEVLMKDSQNITNDILEDFENIYE